MDELANKCNAGIITPAERTEYEGYVYFGTFVALLKSKARQLLTPANAV